MLKCVYSDDLIFEQGVYSLLGEGFVRDYFIIIDFDHGSFNQKNLPFNPRRETIGFASSDLAYYKAENLGIMMVLDKRAKIKDLLDFFLFKRKKATYKIKNPLTLREKELLLLVSGGIQIKDIATILDVNIKTIYTFRRNIMAKMGCRNRVRLYSDIVMS